MASSLFDFCNLSGNNESSREKGGIFGGCSWRPPPTLISNSPGSITRLPLSINDIWVGVTANERLCFSPGSEDTRLASHQRTLDTRRRCARITLEYWQYVCHLQVCEDRSACS